MRFLKGLLREGPTLLGAAVLGVCATMLIFNMVAARVAHSNGIRFWSYPLFGNLQGVVQRTEKQQLTLESALDGSFQAAYARQIGPRVPIYEFAVRVRNQIFFSVLGASSIPSIIVGAKRELIERAYADDYCSRNLRTFLPKARVWAAQIREMQDAVQRRGQTFLYVITPSKIGQYPQFMPPTMPCASTVLDRTELVPSWIALVRAAGVNVVDTTTILSKAHGRYPFALYPKDGTHWNAVGGALAAQTVLATLSDLRKDPTLSPLAFRWHFAEEASGTDIDLAVLMNLLWLPPQDPTPEVDWQPVAETQGCTPLKIVMVGGSFAHALGDSMSREECSPSLVEYEYWHNFVITWENGELGLHPFSEAVRARDLSSADVIIYEDNEQVLGHSEHGQALYQYLMGHPP